MCVFFIVFVCSVYLYRTKLSNKKRAENLNIFVCSTRVDPPVDLVDRDCRREKYILRFFYKTYIPFTFILHYRSLFSYVGILLPRGLLFFTFFSKACKIIFFVTCYELLLLFFFRIHNFFLLFFYHLHFFQFYITSSRLYWTIERAQPVTTIFIFHYSTIFFYTL